MSRPPGLDHPGAGDEQVDLIDEQDRVIGRAARREVRARNLLHRGVGILVWNAAGELYVHRRTLTKDLFPGAHDMWVGGVVDAGESYEAAAQREVAEELGIAGVELRPLFHHVYRGELNHARVALFELEWRGPIRHQPEEVAWGQWMKLLELERWIEEVEFVPDGLELWRRYRDWGAARERGDPSG